MTNSTARVLILVGTAFSTISLVFATPPHPRENTAENDDTTPPINFSPIMSPVHNYYNVEDFQNHPWNVDDPLGQLDDAYYPDSTYDDPGQFQSDNVYNEAPQKYQDDINSTRTLPNQQRSFGTYVGESSSSIHTGSGENPKNPFENQSHFPNPENQIDLFGYHDNIAQDDIIPFEPNVFDNEESLDDPFYLNPAQIVYGEASPERPIHTYPTQPFADEASPQMLFPTTSAQTVFNEEYVPFNTNPKTQTFHGESSGQQPFHTYPTQPFVNEASLQLPFLPTQTPSNNELPHASFSTTPIQTTFNEQPIFQNLHVGESSSSSRTESVDTSMMSIGERNVNKMYYQPEMWLTSVCILNVNDLPDNHGLILQKNRLRGKFILYPWINDKIVVGHHDEIIVSCKIRRNMSYLNLMHGEAAEEVTLKCHQDGKLRKVSRMIRVLDPKEFECKSEVKPIMRKKESSLCGNLTEFEIGLQLTSKTFHSLLYLCMDIPSHSSPKLVFVKSVLSHKLQGQELFRQLPGFYDPSHHVYPKFPFQSMYSYETIKESLLQQLGETRYHQLTAGSETTYHIVPGHVSGRFNHVYRAELKASYFWPNMQPRWSILEENWRLVEIAISKFAAERNEKVVEYSGVQGTQTFLGLQLYLGIFYEKHFVPRLPIPAIFWKLLDDDVNKKCVAIVGHNTTENVHHKKCSDVTGQLLWLKDLAAKKLDSVYACECEEFIQNVWLSPNPNTNHYPVIESKELLNV